MRPYDTATDSLDSIRAALTARDTDQDAQAEAVVRAILEDVKARGDAAVLDYTRRFDWPEATPRAGRFAASTGLQEVLGETARRRDATHH